MTGGTPLITVAEILSFATKSLALILQENSCCKYQVKIANLRNDDLRHFPQGIEKPYLFLR